jgi:phage baseplate assembly protein V
MRTPEDHPTDADDLIRIGTVASVDLADGRCTVLFDDDSESGPIRWQAARMGAIRVWVPPSEGEQVFVLCPAGEVAGASIVGSVPSDDNPPPATTNVALIDFADGAVLQYDPTSHALTFTLPGGGTLGIVADGGVTIEGDVNVTGTLTATTDVVGGGKSLKGHKHTGVQAGGGISGAPQ